jgi:hypothetical protein
MMQLTNKFGQQLKKKKKQEAGYKTEIGREFH